MDIEGVFDQTPKETIIKMYGERQRNQTVINWISSYLRERTMKDRLEDCVIRGGSLPEWKGGSFSPPMEPHGGPSF